MTEPTLFRLWVYLAATPLSGLALTLTAYCAAYALYAKARLHPVFNPVLVSVLLIAAVLHVTSTTFETYFDGAQFVHFLLGPAVVGLSAPLARDWKNVKRLAIPIGGALVAGSVIAVTSALACAYVLGATPSTLSALAPKSVTAPIAMGIAEDIGGIPALAAVFAVATGVIGASFGKLLLDGIRVRDWRARGFALGVAAHGIGTARAFQVNREAGAYAGLGLALHGALAALLLPTLWRLFG